MSYLERLKQIEGQKIFAHIPEPVLTKPPKAPLVSSVSTARGAYIKTQTPNVERVQVAKVDAGETATAFLCWLIHYPDRDPLEVACCSDATDAEILASYPDAIAAEPFKPTIQQPSVPMTADEEHPIYVWLTLIGESDPAAIAEVLSQCQRDADADARDYFTGRAAAELPKPDPFPDDRRRCPQCLKCGGGFAR